ncbi:MAG: hypothetical protein EBQ51_02215 [Verrucomicrobia bacterium]|nr:hypothetical protein [Pseudomonadota bacterium]NBS78475.1 hypothetical protein [bacterium]NBT23319.1 hypothetical protein [bacterium]NBV96173.1 hypothetical protein [Verrucomicrobiota bacterium]NBY65883.1 hypothetical protein [Verrucomicrobiota bacterium]
MFHGQKIEKKAVPVQSTLGAVLVFFCGGLAWGQMEPPEEQVIPERDVREEQFAEPTLPKEANLKLTGYVDGTYLYNFGPGTAASPIDFPTDTIPRGDFNLSALWLRLEKPLTKGNSLEAGLQAGIMLGEDATYYAAAGTANSPNGPDSSSLYVGEAFAKFWVPDAQMEMWVGKFQAVIGYETIWRPDNPCITFGIADAFMPQDNIGILAIFSPDPLFDIAAGIANCSGESNDLASLGTGDEASIMSYAKIQNPGGNATLQPGFYISPWGTHGSNARISLDQNFYYAWNLIGQWSPSFAEGRWNLTFNLTGGSGTGTPGIEAPTTYVTTGLYSTWTLIDPVTLTGRAEYVHTSNYVLPQSTRLSGGDYYDYTLTLAVNITEELVWRGEGRFAWGAGTTLSTNPSQDILEETLYSPASSSLWTLATEIYYRF